MKKDKHTKGCSRRAMIKGLAALGGGGMLLPSLATGIPARILLSPLSARAQEAPVGRVLVVSSTAAGEPVNANVPGTYLGEIAHPTSIEMAPSTVRLGDAEFTAARPWAQLPQSVLNQTCFFHHATYTQAHTEMRRVHRLMGATSRDEMLVSLLAKELAPRLGSIQDKPLSLGASATELLSSGGQRVANVSPLSVKELLTGERGKLSNLADLRDLHLDRIYGMYRERGTPSQLKMLDEWARSRDSIRGLETALVEQLEAIDGNDQRNQLRAAVVLAGINLAPVFSVRLNFGGDNHRDQNLSSEAEAHVETLGDLGAFFEDLAALRRGGYLRHDVMFCTLGAFGRSLRGEGNGRGHHDGHHVMALMGPGVRPGVVGGVALRGREYFAEAIDSSSGLPSKGGDIPYEETLGAAGKTLGVAVGVSAERMDELVTRGRVVQSAVEQG